MYVDFAGQSARTAPAWTLLKNEHIVGMAKAGFDVAIIATRIGSSKCRHQTATGALIRLKQRDVTVAVSKPMVGAGRQ